MNWKNVLLLISVDVKSSRLIRGSRLRRFLENKLITYALYICACLFGVLTGLFIGNLYHVVQDPEIRRLILQGATDFFISLPTLALLYGIVLTQMSQIQRLGAKVSVQPLYWLPITWKEHTLASLLANIIGAPLIISIFFSFSVFVVSMFLGLSRLASLTILALFASVFMASATTEILRVLQVRLSGAVTRFAGRAAVWVRLVWSIVFFVAFYVIYFSLWYNVTPLALVESIASGQSLLWFVPYTWLGLTLFTFSKGSWLEAALFSVGSLLFLYLLFLFAVRVNIRYGLYEAPSITISRGVYVSKAGMLGRLGLSQMEAAIVRKDMKAFTRRRELMYIFILPIVFVVMPLLSAMRRGAGFPAFLFTYLTVLPGAFMTVFLGSSIVGSEGGSVWFLYSCPMDARALVKVKYLFTVLFSLLVALVCSAIGAVLTLPSTEVVLISLTESLLLIFSLGMVSLSFGIKGADFREFPRPRMIKPLWGLINMLVCLALGLAVISPVIPYVLNLAFQARQSGSEAPMWAKNIFSLPEYYSYVALPVSGIVALAITFGFHRLALKNAEELLAKAEEWASM
jgi:hypothetical protein